MAVGKATSDDRQKDRSVIMLGSRQGGSSSLSSLSGAKFVQRLKTSKKLQTKANVVKVGDEVSFVYGWNKINGKVRFVGSTDFSAGKWCGVELTENIGKNNGTFKGRSYFTCSENRGVFIPYRKVTVVPKFAPSSLKHTQSLSVEDETDMRITLRSVMSVPCSLPSPNRIQNDEYIFPEKHTTENSEPQIDTVMRYTINEDEETTSAVVESTQTIRPTVASLPTARSSGSCDSRIESPVRSFVEERPKQPSPVMNSKNKSLKEKTKSSTKKNIVISSFNTPGPKKPVFLKSSKKNNKVETEDNNLHESNGYDEPGEDIFVDHSDYSYKKEFIRNNLETSFEENIKAIDIPNAESFDKSTFEEEMNVFSSSGLHGSVFVEDTEDSNNDRKRINSQTSPENIDKTSKIPIKINSTSFNKHIADEHEDKEIKSKKKLSLKERALTSIPIATVLRRTPKEQTENKIKISKVSHNRKNEAPSNSKKVTKVTTRRLSTKQSEDKCDIEPGGNNEEPPFVMGNSHVTGASLCKQNSVGCEAGINNRKCADEYTQRDAVGSVVVTDKKVKSKENKVKENKHHKVNFSVRQNGYIHNSKSKKEGKKDLLKEIEDLNNILNKRNERISQLEISLKDNNNQLEERNELEKSKNELQILVNLKNYSLVGVEGKLNCTKSLLNHSNKSVEGMTIVLQNYLKQIEQLNETHLSTQEEKKTLKDNIIELTTQNQESKLAIETLTTKLDAQICLCQNLQKEVETIESNHVVEIQNLHDKHNADQIELRAALDEQNGMALQKVSEEYQQEIEKIKVGYETKVEELNTTYKNEVEHLKNLHENNINKMALEHNNIIDEKMKEHNEVIETIEQQYTDKYSELQAKYDELTAVKVALDSRLLEVMKELESDAKVQAAVLQYTHLPDELQSLQIVLDMKNKELKNLRVKNMELGRRVDDYYELQAKFENLNQKNQSLSEVLKQKAHVQRQISVERDSFMEKFEQENRKVSRLSMEKEQLLWRASNSDLSYSSPNVFPESEEESDLPPSPLRSSLSTTPPRSISKKLKRRSVNFPITTSDYNIK